MDHLNIFNGYKHKSNNHEDELTRSFLILIKHIPMVQIMFFDIVRRENDAVDSMVNGNLNIEEVYTQLSNNNDIFSNKIVEGRTLVSIIISDDRLDSEITIQNDDRQARYDGVILCSPSWLFIIENKPSKDNIWIRQLNPNISENADIIINEKPCCISWREILTRLNDIIQKEMVSGADKVFIEDFIQYVDSEYSWINPYTKFSICKNDGYLLNKRCISVMANTKIGIENTEVQYHKGWKHYVSSGKSTIKLIALDANKQSEKWEINLWLYVGDTMKSAKQAYEKIDLIKINELLELGFTISKNFHISYRSSNLIGFDGNLSIEDYLKYWKEEYKNLKQVKRADFNDFFVELEENQIIIQTDNNIIDEKIKQKKYDKINICPGFLIKYTWDSETAIRLDNKNEFETDYRDKIIAAFEVFGEKFIDNTILDL